MTALEKSKDDPQAELTRALTRLGNSIADAKGLQNVQREKRGEVIQFPLFAEGARPVSNDVARSALFSCVQGKDRRTIKDVLIATAEGVQIRFTGEQFNQDDHDLLMQLVHIAARKPLGEYVTIPAYALLKILGRKTGGKDYQQLRTDLTRLIAGTVSIRNSKSKIEYIGHVVDDAIQDEKIRYWVFKLNPKLCPLYSNTNHTLVDWKRRKNLRGKDLARWLQLYIASHAAPFPVKVATLRQLSGSRTAELFKFRQGLRIALGNLVENGDITGWVIDPGTDLVALSRGGATTNSQRRYLAKPKARKKGTGLEVG